MATEKYMLKLYDTRTKSLQEFQPRVGKNVGLYTCGPTVYNYAHIGNLRTYIFEDVLRRTLKQLGYTVRHVMNITDVGHLTDDADQGEDKMEKGSAREGMTALEIADKYAKAFKDDMKDLNVLEPTVWCRATEHIQEQIQQVQTLMDKGHTYETSDGIYFDTTTIDDYGKLANLQEQDLQAGNRVSMGDKKSEHDFALWKFSEPDSKRQMEWEAFGKMGFPGWHIECSAMSMKYLGDQFDIHCGGIDHIPVHHTNEIAQAEAASGKKPWVHYWMHGEFLLMKDDKMAKSGDNFVTLAALKNKGLSPLAYRFYLLQAHYRRQLGFSWEALEAAQSGLHRLRRRVQALEHGTLTDPKVLRKFMEAIKDDLNTAEAIAVLWEALKEGSINLETVTAMDKILGLSLREHNKTSAEVPKEVLSLVAAREEARKSKDWTQSDLLRDEISTHGYRVEDTDAGQEISKL